MYNKRIKIAFIAVLLTVFSCFLPICKISAKGEGGMEAKAECVIEQNSGRILYEAKGDLRLPMASTTKIVTAITVLDHCNDLQKKIEIPKEAVGIEGSSVYLQESEHYTVEELLYGLMLRSGNDCAVALALSFGNTMGEFIAKMNETAQRAGALNSRFENPHGLPSKNHYTTARDLCYITRYAMKNPIFSKIVATEYYSPRAWKNKNKMLTGYEGAIGVKTGYTKAAGRCLVSAATRNGMMVICTVLNCQAMYERSRQLMDDAFRSYRYVPLITSGTTLTVNECARGKVCTDYYYPLMQGEEVQLEIRTQPYSASKNQKVMGQFGIYLSKRLLFSGNLYKL